MDGPGDLHGLVGMVLRLAELAARTALLGGVAFWALLLPPLRPALPPAEAAALGATARRQVLWSALAGALAEILRTAFGLWVLATTLEAPVAGLLGAGFVQVAGLSVLAMLVLAALALPRGEPGRGRRAALLLGAVALLGAVTAGSHAMARTEDRAVLLGATALHQAGAALWLGGLPALLAALKRAPETALLVGRRYSRSAAAGVGLVLTGTLGFWKGYIGEVEALYGTAYGAMAATKAAMFGLTLLLGAGNYLLLHHLTSVGSGLLRIRRFVEGEVAFGLAMLAVAASLTSVPPASDLREGRVTWEMVAERLTPAWPRLSSPGPADPALQARPDAAWPRPPIPGEGPAPPPRNAGDIAWGGHDHRWAGIMVLLAGLSALLDASGQVPLARHWPPLFLGLAGLVLVRSGPEAWPPGGIPLPDSLRDPEAVRHRLAGLLVAGIAAAEWAARLGWLGGRARFAFPLAMLGGGVLLLARTHAIPGTGEALLAELPYLPLAVLAMVGGVARWTELRGPEELGRLARWIWPAALILMGLLLTLYHEA